MTRFPSVQPPPQAGEPPGRRASPDLLPLLVDQLPTGILAVGPDLRTLLANDWIVEFFKPFAVDAVAGEAPNAWARVAHPDGRPVRPGTLPLERCVRVGKAVEAQELIYHSPTGDRHIAADATPVTGLDGTILAYASTVHDLTTLRQVVDQLGDIHRELDTHIRELNRVHSLIERLSSRVDLPELLADALEVIAELDGADAVAIYLADPVTEELSLEASRGLGEAELELIRPLDQADLFTSRRAMLGLSTTIVDVGREPGLSAAYRAAVQGIGAVSIYSMPLRSADSGLLGAVVSLFRKLRMPTAHQKQIIDTCGRIIAQLIVNARRRARDHDVATRLQLSMMQPQLPEVPGAELAAFYRAGSADMAAGGDWYQTTEISGGRLCLTIGDAVGHGVEAVGTMGQIRSAVRAYTLPSAGRPTPGPLEVLELLDHWVTSTGLGEVSTVCTAVVDPLTGHCALASAGHPPPLLVSGGAARPVYREAIGVPLGLRSLAEPAREARFTMPPGSVLLFYTDGLVERRGENLQQGLDRLAAASARELDGVPDGELAARCRRLAFECAPADSTADDVALLAFRARR